MADNEGQEAQGAAEPQAQEETQEAQTFSADYVKELRDEAKGWRLKVRDLEKQVKGLTDTAEAGKRAELEEQGKYKEIADDAMSKLNHLQGVEAENKRYVESLGALLEAQKGRATRLHHGSFRKNGRDRSARMVGQKQASGEW